MIHCKKPECKFEAWRGRLCYKHSRESQGFVFDPQLRVFVKAQDLAVRSEMKIAARHRIVDASPRSDLMLT